MFSLPHYALEEFFTLTEADMAALNAEAVVDVVAAARVAVCRAQALQIRAIEQLARIRRRSEWVAEEIAPELPAGRPAAELRVDLAHCLVTRLPNLLAAMDAGELDLWAARK